MIRLALALFAALASAGPARSAEIAAASDAPLTHALESLASQLGEANLELSYRGRTVSVTGRIAATDDPCSPDLAARGAGKTREWRRSLDFADLAWLGEMHPGQLSLVFYEPVARLANDIVTVKGAPNPAIREAVSQLAAACRARSAGAAFAPPGTTSAPFCYFPSLPGLTLFPASGAAGDKPRAVLTLMARQTPAGELSILAEKEQAPSDASEGWPGASVSFIFADPAYQALGIRGASFQLDDKPVAVDHSLAAFGTTRVRISMDGFSGGGQANGSAPFVQRLVPSRTATLVLTGTGGQEKLRLEFDLADRLAAARQLLAGIDWSCAGAKSAAHPAARWRGALD